MDSKVTFGFYRYKQWMLQCTAFLMLLDVCVPTWMQVLLWGKYLKRTTRLASSTHIFLLVSPNCLPKMTIILFSGLDIVKWFNSLIISIITCEVKPLFIIFIECSISFVNCLFAHFFIHTPPPYLFVGTFSVHSRSGGFHKPFFYKRPGSKYFGLVDPYDICGNYATLLL